MLSRWGLRNTARVVLVSLLTVGLSACGTTQTVTDADRTLKPSEDVPQGVPDIFKEVDDFVRAWEIAVRSGEAANRRNLEDALALTAKENFSTFVEAMKGDRAEMKAIASAALGFSRDRRAVVWLVIGLKDKDSQVRNNAALGLAILRDETTPVEKLADVMLNDSEDEVRSNAALAISRMVGVGDAKGVYDSIVVGCSDKSPLVRRNVAAALAVIRSPQSFDVLAEKLVKDSDAVVRLNAVAALVRLEDRRVPERLVGCLDDPDERVAELAVEGLKRKLGADLGKDPEAWRNWLRENQKRE